MILNVIDGADSDLRYQFADRDRQVIFWSLAALFALAVIGLGDSKV